MENRREGRRLFDATLVLKREEITGASLASALARQPFASLVVLGRIHWQALRLLMKGAPFHSHPKTVIAEKIA
jgi:DUF1365 family protein